MPVLLLVSVGEGRRLRGAWMKRLLGRRRSGDLLSNLGIFLTSRGPENGQSGEREKK